MNDKVGYTVFGFILLSGNTKEKREEKAAVSWYNHQKEQEAAYENKFRQSRYYLG